MLKTLLRDTKGNFGTITALLMVPMMAMAGMSVDLGAAYVAKSALQGAADAAALGAVAERSPAVQQALKMTSNGSASVGEQDARALFNSQLAPHDRIKILDIEASVQKRGRTILSTVKYTAEIPTTFLSVIGRRTIRLAGTATAEYESQVFRNFYLLLDNTPSMGVAATPADVTTMVNNTPDQCAFACHISNGGVEDPNDYYNLAKKLGVTIRIDVVAKATATLMDTATSERRTSDQFRMAIYTFGQKAEDTKLLEVSPLTVDLAAAKQKAADVKLMTIPYQGYNNDQQTSFDTALTQIKDKMGPQGTGASAADPEKILFFVADGVGDSEKPTNCTKRTTGARCQEPIDVRYCDALKAANYKVAVLYTTYLPLPTNGWYNYFIAPFQNEIPNNMRSCASEGLYFEVSPSQGIADAMNALFIRIISQPRLTG
jgi:hypothetical protein